MKYLRDMQVVVLMGGLATRLGSVSEAVPKSMLDVHGKPFFLYQLSLMRDQGFRKFVFCIGHNGSVIKRYFGDGRKFGVNIKYSSDGDTLLGTGGALKKAESLLNKEFMLIYGDSYMDVDYQEIIYNYSAAKDKKHALLAIFKNQNKFDKSNVVFRNGKLLDYDKRSMRAEMEYIDYGIAILNKNVISRMPAGRFLDLADVYRDLVKKGYMTGYEVRRRFFEIGTPRSLDEFRDFMEERKRKQKAVFFDRDGTLNRLCYNEGSEEVDSPFKEADMRLLPNVVECVKKVKRMGYKVIIVTNQPGAAKGKVTLEGLYRVNNRLLDMLKMKGTGVDDVFICFHHPVGDRDAKDRFLIKKCDCRKPAAGLLKQAMKKHNIDMARSYMVGDSYTDVMAGYAAGVKTVFLGRYKCDACQRMGKVKADYIFDDIKGFADFISEEKGKKWCKRKRQR